MWKTLGRKNFWKKGSSEMRIFKHPDNDELWVLETTRGVGPFREEILVTHRSEYFLKKDAERIAGLIRKKTNNVPFNSLPWYLRHI